MSRHDIDYYRVWAATTLACQRGIYMIDPFLAATIPLGVVGEQYDDPPGLVCQWLGLPLDGKIAAWRGLASLDNLDRPALALAKLLNDGSPMPAIVRHHFHHVSQHDLLDDIIPKIEDPLRQENTRQILAATPSDVQCLVYYLRQILQERAA